MEELIEKYSERAIEMLFLYGPKLIYALATFIIGLWIIKMIVKAFVKLLTVRKIAPSLVPFLRSLIDPTFKVMLTLSVMGMIGIEMTSFIAVLGAAGLAVGMALSGTLQNLAGGVMILVFRPYKVGDVIEAQSYLGVVKEIQIFNTILTTFDNKTIIIPNGKLANDSMVNYTTQGTRRVDWTFGISYGENTSKVKEVLERLIKEDARILNDPEPLVAVSALADSSVNFAMRVWVKSDDYWPVFFDMNNNVYNTFNMEGISFPFPQMDVHLHQKK